MIATRSDETINSGIIRAVAHGYSRGRMSKRRTNLFYHSFVTAEPHRAEKRFYALAWAENQLLQTVVLVGRTDVSDGSVGVPQA